MATRRYELSTKQWNRIKDMLPGVPSAPGMLPGVPSALGATGRDNRLFVNGVLWILRSGAPWRHLPERYGDWKKTHRRFSRWAKSGVWEKIFADLTADSDNDYIAIDSTIVRAHQHAASARGKKKIRRWGVPEEA